MGYESYITGEGVIEPGLDEATLRAWGVWADSPDDHTLYVVSPMVGEPDTVGLVNGSIEIIPGKSHNDVAFRYDDRGKYYSYGESLQELANKCANAGVKLNADFRVQGEDEADLSRLVSVDNTLTELRPTLVWPDGLIE